MSGSATAFVPAAACAIAVGVAPVSAGATAPAAAAQVALPEEQGPAGPPGADGDDTSSFLTLTAVATVGAHLIVRPAGGSSVSTASAATLADADTAIGMAVTAANAGGGLSIQVSGLVTEPTWAWSIGPVYLAVDGALTQTPAGGFVQQIGVAVAPTQIVLGLRPAIILS